MQTLCKYQYQSLRTIRPNPAQKMNKRCAATHPPLRTFLLSALWHRFCACGAVLPLNVANVVMLPIPMLPVANLSRRPYWELEIETGNSCILAILSQRLLVLQFFMYLPIYEMQLFIRHPEGFLQLFQNFDIMRAKGESSC